MAQIYLDNAATTRIDPAVLDAMMPWLTDEYGNPGSAHGLGRRAREAVENARAQVAALINAKPEQILFTSGGCEANALAILGTYNERLRRGRSVCVTTPLEHESVQKCVAKAYSDDAILNCNVLVTHQKDSFGNTIYLKPPKMRKEHISLVSCMLANNEVPIAYTDDLQYYLDKCKEHEALIHGDAVQALSCMKIDVRKEQIWYDFLSMSGHKIHAPKGVGALYVKHKEFLAPQILGGNGQEFGLRAGTENVASIVGFGKACEILMNNRKEIFNNNLIMAMAFDRCIRVRAAELGFIDKLRRNGTQTSKVLSYTVQGIDAETLIFVLDNAGVCVSAGSACTDHARKASHVLTGIGLSEQQARSTFRVSFSRFNTVEEASAAGKIAGDCIKQLLDMSGETGGAGR